MSIERLPESIHRAVRSGAVIRDLTTIVEELIFNSLEAGATKVSVAVGVDSCFVKVVDNGSGITRDGLVHLGEQHASSKVDQMTAMDTGVESVDFHGESLCLISNVSSLEIVTKVHGKPNGYRKIMKNSKCLFLGINDDRQEVGTTVTVRDIFYNQPVRRKHMESSRNKVLDSIKTSVLRVALVHFNVCFKVVDVESADELLRYGSSSSPLSLLSSNFGMEDSRSFYKVDFSDGELKLSGFISDPCEKFYLKAIQYVYINSRFISKGPINKLVNQLAIKFDSFSWLPASSSQNEKQSKYDIFPTFILNLCCPRSYYDMIRSEQSRRLVEFKDWGPVLTFVENGIMRLWAQNISCASHTGTRRSCALGSDMLDTSQRKKRRIKQDCHISLDLSSTRPKKLHKNDDSAPASEEYISSIGKASRRVPVLKKHHTGAGFPSETAYQSRSCDRSLADYKVTMKNDISSPLSRNNGFFQENVPYAYDTIVDTLSSSTFENSLQKFDDTISYVSTSSGVSTDCVKFGDKDFVGKDCSKMSPNDWSAARDEQHECGRDDDARIWKRWVGCDDDLLGEIKLVSFGKDLHHNGSSPSEPSSMIHKDMYEIPKFSDSLKKFWKGNSSLLSFSSGRSPMPMEKGMGINFQDEDDAIYKTSVEDYPEFSTSSVIRYSASREEEDLKYGNLNPKDCWPQGKCSAMFSPHENKRGITEYHREDTENVFSLKPFKQFSEIDWFPLPSYVEESPRKCSLQLSSKAPPWERVCGRASISNQNAIFTRKRSSVRSHSAPPCYKGRKRYLDLTDSSTILSAKGNIRNSHAKLSTNEPTNSICTTTEMKCLQKPFGPCLLSPVKRSLTDCSFSERQGIELTPETVVNQNRASNRDKFVNFKNVECLDMKELEDSFDSRCKWRNCSPTTGGDVLDYKNQESILDISSEILDLAGDSLVPKSIGRMTLEDAKVLNQVDKKFIPVVAGRYLAIIDQHAADERIRLEELRHKVLTGEMRTITYLDADQELVFPEIGYQLLHSYAEQVQTWGWICNIHSEDTSSFAKHLDYLHRQSTVVKLLGVPCILGVNLTDIDLLEYLQQLADTDGSSSIPPSVNRILNNKACRGAIMFGDMLLPSECSLIVEELKRTSLCFQCAHGRPTTVPLVNMDILHRKIAKHDSHEVPWHGLRQYKLSLERSTQRLNSALG